MSFFNQNGFFVLLLLLLLLVIKSSVKNISKYFSKDMEGKIFIGKNQKKIKLFFLILAFICLVIALSRPVELKEPIKIKQPVISLVVAFDISKSMSSKDVFPNRLSFAKNKFTHFISLLKNEKVGALAFSQKAFLISPITSDYETLKYLVANMKPDYVNRSGTNLLEALKGVETISENEEKKALIFFTDGGDGTDFSQEIAFANEHKIKVFIYGIGSLKGGVIEDNGDLLQDKDKNIVISKINEKIQELAIKTDGAYLDFSTSNDDMEPFLDEIRAKFEPKTKDEILINQNKEWFFIPLVCGLVFFSLAIFGVGRR